MKIGIALSGGGIRGIAHAGVLQALLENKISNYEETLPIELGKRALEMLKDPYIFENSYNKKALE